MKLFESFEWEKDIDDLADMMQAGLLDGSQFNSGLRDVLKKQDYGLAELIEVANTVRLDPSIIQEFVADAVKTEEVAAIHCLPEKAVNIKDKKSYGMVNLYAGGKRIDNLVYEEGSMTHNEAMIESTKHLMNLGFRFIYVRTGRFQPYAYIRDTVSGMRINLTLSTLISKVDKKMGIDG